MAQPDNMPIARPASLPAEARWDPKDAGFEWVLGPLDADGRRHGAYRFWTRDGLLHGDSGYDHGKVCGKNLNYHPDGSLASEGDWLDDLCRDCVFYKSDKPSPEPWPEAGDNVRSIRYYSRDGKTNYTIRFFDAAGVEVGQDGEPLPPRATGISATARWFPDQDRWVDGAIERGTNNQVGEWRWWDKAGVLRHYEERDAKGDTTTSIDYEEDGSIDEKTVTNPDGSSQRDVFFTSGKLSFRYLKDAAGRETYKGSWYEDGSIDEENVHVYDGDALVAVTERVDDGAIKFEAKREGDALACVLYDDDAKHVMATGLIRDDHLVGVWRLVAPDGQLRREVDTSKLGIWAKPSGDNLGFRLGRAVFTTDVDSLPLPEQLRGVDDIAWDELDGAYEEEVPSFPRYLRAMASPDAFVRQYAYGMIDSETEHQGSVYPATAAVIPWFAKLLSHPNADRQTILQAILTYGENAAPWLDDDDEDAEDEAEDQDEDGDEDDEDEDDGPNPVVETVKAIDEAWPRIWALFDVVDEDDKRRILVIAKHAPAARPMLLDVARNHADPGMRACAIDSLTSRGKYALDDVAPSLWDPDPLVRTVTAIQIATTRGPESPGSVVPVLASALRSWQDLDTPWDLLPFTDGHIIGSLSLALGSVRSSDARALAPLLCASIEKVDGVSATSVARGLLALALGNGEPPYAPTFIDVLDTLAHSKQFWVFNVNAGEVLDSWNLRQGFDGGEAFLGQLVKELRAADDPTALMQEKMRGDDDGDDGDDDDDDEGDDDDDDDDEDEDDDDGDDGDHDDDEN